MKKMWFVSWPLVFIILLSVVMGCGQGGGSSGTTTTCSTTSTLTVTTTSSTTTTTSGTKTWTVMVYMGGDNDLSGEVYSNLLEMVQVGSDANINMLAQLDFMGQGTTRYYITPGTYEATFLGTSIDSASTETLTTFINYCVDNYPAQHYMLVLSDHGSGWKPLDTVTTQGVIDDWTFNTEFNMLQLKAVMAAMYNKIGRKIDILGFDACLMDMLEVGYQFKDYVNYMVASEAVEPGAGWSYQNFLTYWKNNYSAEAPVLASNIVDEYKISMEARGEKTTLAATNLASLEAIAGALQSFAGAFPAAEFASLRTLRDAKADGVNYTIQSYQHDYQFQYYRDLYDLADKVAANFSSYTDLVNACTAIKNSVNLAVINSKTTGTTYANSHGLSIYFPTRFQDMPSYSSLDFSQGSGASWEAFINALTTGESNPQSAANFALKITWEGDAVVDLICREFQEISYTNYNDYSSNTSTTTPNGYFTFITGENNVIFQSNNSVEAKYYTFRSFVRSGGIGIASADVYVTLYENGLQGNSYYASNKRGRALASGEAWSMACYTIYGTTESHWSLSPNINR